MARAKKALERPAFEAYLAGLPAWARALAERYRNKTDSTFILHGAVRDLQPGENDQGDATFVSLPEFLETQIFGPHLFVLYDRSRGLRCADKDAQRELLAAATTIFGEDGIPKDPQRVLPLLESFVRQKLAGGAKVALVVDFAESIAPAAEFASMGAEDRFALVTLVRWAQDPIFRRGECAVCLIAENLAELSPRLSRNPYVAAIEVPLPDEAARLDYIQWKFAGRRPADVSELSYEALAQRTAGVSRAQLDRILGEALAGARLSAERVKERKKEIIQAECHGLLEFIEPRWNLDYVAGHARCKEMLRAAADALRGGDTDVVPMGYLIAGPIGTGKTFLATCFAGEIGIPVVKFLNFRSQWQGVTEGNLEKIFNLLRAMNPVAVIIDEADAFLGNRGQSGDSGTSARVFAAIAAFMGNTEYRGKIVWFLLTCRPDLLPVDLKRQGRAEEHLALFYPETPDERAELLRVMAKKSGVTLDAGADALLPPGAQKLSGADIEALLVRAKFRALAQKRRTVTHADLEATLADFVPPSYPQEVELQTLAAIVECTSRELIPASYRDLPRDELTRRLALLKSAAGD